MVLLVRILTTSGINEYSLSYSAKYSTPKLLVSGSPILSILACSDREPTSINCTNYTSAIEKLTGGDLRLKLLSTFAIINI